MTPFSFAAIREGWVTMASLPIAEPGKLRWTNRSVLTFAGGSDPVQTLLAKVRDLVFRAFESGWAGPPYDPFALAALLGIEVSPSKDVIDAQTLTGSGSSLRIEFNPDRPVARISHSPTCRKPRRQRRRTARDGSVNLIGPCCDAQLP